MEHDEKIQIEMEIRAILATPGGRRFIWRLLHDRIGILRGSFFGGDTHSAAYSEGRRSVGLELLADMQATDPNGYVEMVVEAADAARAKELERQKLRNPSEG